MTPLETMIDEISSKEICWSIDYDIQDGYSMHFPSRDTPVHFYAPTFSALIRQAWLSLFDHERATWT